MCGFAGWTGQCRLYGGERTLLRAMGQLLANRGPDEERLCERRDLHLVFRRLAINDVSRGSQPFVVADGTVIVAVNGEIYNHRELALRELTDVTLSSCSDCEVVAHLYVRMGVACLDKLNGIFALAIWDDRRKTLVLARDRLGVKPLYYAQVAGGLVFASELKALLLHPDAPREIDWSAFEVTPTAVFPFERPGDQPVSTGVKDVAFVPPAAFVEWRAGHIHPPQRYWDLLSPAFVSQSACCAPEEYVERYRDLLSESIRLQTLDVLPMGLFLSGGLDSSLIAALAGAAHRKLTAFTLTEPSIARTGDPRAARQLAHALGIPLHVLRVDVEALQQTLSFDLGVLEYFVWTMDFPLFDMEQLFKHELHRFARAIVPEMKVVLLGQGADEFAGGYSRIASRSWDAFAASEEQHLHAARARAMGVPAVYRTIVNPARLRKAGTCGTCMPWQCIRFGDLSAYNLWHEDRMASSNGMEVRVPFLDHRLIEFLCSIPAHLQAQLFYDKAIERRAAAGLLPSHCVGRAKVPLYPGGGSVAKLQRLFMLNAFDGYREKYLTSPRSLFSKSAMERLHARAALQADDGAANLLWRCMAVGVFERMCSEAALPDFVPPRLAAAAPPLGADRTSAKPADAEPQLMLAHDVVLAVSCAQAPDLLVIERGSVAARLPLAPGAAPTFDAVVAGRISIPCLSALFGVDPDQIKPVLDALLNRRWAALVTAPDNHPARPNENESDKDQDVFKRIA